MERCVEDGWDERMDGMRGREMYLISNVYQIPALGDVAAVDAVERVENKGTRVEQMDLTGSTSSSCRAEKHGGGSSLCEVSAVIQ